MLDCTPQPSECRVVGEQVRERSNVRDIVNSHDFHPALLRDTEKDSSHPTKTVNGYPDGHNSLSSLFGIDSWCTTSTGQCACSAHAALTDPNRRPANPP